MKIKYFSSQTIFNNEDKQTNPFIKYTSDTRNQIFLFLNKNNSVLYYNSQNSIIKTIDEYKNLSLVNFIIFPNLNYITLLYSNGDIIFISINFIESEGFDHYWTSIASMKKNMLSYPSTKQRSPLFGEFLLCGSNSSLNLKRNLIMKNLFKDFLTDQTPTKSTSSSISISSCAIWINQKEEFKEYLIISYDNNLMILSIANGNVQCDYHMKFASMIYCIHLVAYSNSLQFMIIHTESKFYHLPLYDKDSDIYIFSSVENKLDILNFMVNSIISIQKYNGNAVICVLTQDNSFDIYSVFDFKNPIIEINLNTPKYGAKDNQIINCFLYEKLLIILSKKQGDYYLSMINYWICNPGTQFHKSTIHDLSVSLWCDVNYGMLKDYIIIQQGIGKELIKCVYNSEFINERNNELLFVLTNDMLMSIVPSSINELITNLASELKLRFGFEELRKIELLNNGLNGMIFDYTDIIANEIQKEKEIMLKLIWNSSGFPNEKILLDKVLNERGIKERMIFITNIIDYIFLNKLSKENKKVYIEYLCKMYLTIYFDMDILSINSYLSQNKTLEKLFILCELYLFSEDKEKDINLTLSNTMVHLSNSSEEDEEDIGMKLLIKKKENDFSEYKKQNIFLVSHSTSYSIKNTFEKILFCSLNTNDISPNMQTKKLDDILVESLNHTDIRSLILVSLLDDKILLSDRMVEEILILKFKKIFKNVSEMFKIFTFFYELFGKNKNIINSRNKIEMCIKPLFSLINPGGVHSQTKLDIQDLLQFIEKTFLPFIFIMNTKKNILSNNSKSFLLNKILSIFLLFFFISLFIKMESINDNLIKVIHNFIFMFDQFGFHHNKNLTKYYYMIMTRLSYYSNKGNNKIDEEHKINSDEYYSEFLNLLKQKIKIENIETLIGTTDTNLFKQNKLFEIFSIK